MNGNDLSLSAAKLFERLNIYKAESGKTEVLEESEVKEANKQGFSIFNLTNNMTEEDFEKAYNDAMNKAKSENQEETFYEKVNEVHIKYIQRQYVLDESVRPKYGESIEAFESRVAQTHRDIRLEQEKAKFESALKAELDKRNIQVDNELYSTLSATPGLMGLSEKHKSLVLEYILKHLAEINDTNRNEVIENLNTEIINIVEGLQGQEFYNGLKDRENEKNDPLKAAMRKDIEKFAPRFGLD